MTLVFFGTSGFGLPALEALSRSSHRMLAVVTTPERPSGRGREIKPSPIKAWAQAHDVATIEYSPQAQKEILSLKPDLFVVISFGRLLKKDLLGVPKTACVNVHASLLPRWRGASPMQSAILSGDQETGVSVMRMVEALDAGDVLLSKRLPLTSEETLPSLETKLSALGAEALLESLSLLGSGQALWTPQDAKSVTVCAKIKKEDGRLVWSKSAQELDRQVRAFVAWPGSFAFFGPKRLVIKKVRPEALSDGEPGRVLEAGAGGIAVACQKGRLVIEELQQEGRRSMAAGEFLKGFPLKPGDILI